MLTEQELKDEGYIVLPKGGWIRLDPTIMPHDWHDICKDFGCDPDCNEIIIAVSGVKEIKGDDDGIV